MENIIYLIIGVVIIVLFFKKPREKVVGICVVAVGLDTKKRENKEKILTLLTEKSELSNSDIREALGVSSSSVARYMDELETEGKVEQIGSTGRNVTYRLKQ